MTHGIKHIQRLDMEGMFEKSIQYCMLGDLEGNIIEFSKKYLSSWRIIKCSTSVLTEYFPNIELYFSDNPIQNSCCLKQTCSYILKNELFFIINSKHHGGDL